jgi:hypothetical protein
MLKPSDNSSHVPSEILRLSSYELTISDPSNFSLSRGRGSSISDRSRRNRSRCYTCYEFGRNAGSRPRYRLTRFGNVRKPRSVSYFAAEIAYLAILRYSVVREQ